MTEPLYGPPIPQSLRMLGGLWRQHPRYRGCVGHWMAWTEGGDKYYDLTGQGNTGTYLGNNGVSNHRLSTIRGERLIHDFNQITRVDCGAKSLHAPSNMSWSWWGFGAGTGNATFRGPISKTNGGNWTQGWGSYDGANAGEVYHFVGQWNLNRILHTAPGGVAGLDAPHAFCVSWNGTAGVLRGWFNGGNEQTQTSTPGTYSSTGGSSANTLFLGMVGSTNFCQNGVVDDVRIYNRVLTQADALSLWQNPFLEFEWAERVLYALWRMTGEQAVVGGVTPRLLSLLGVGR